MWHTASTEPSCDATSCCRPRVTHQRHQANLLQTCPHSRGCRVSLLYKTNPSKELPLAFWVLNASGQGFQLYTRGAVKGLALMGGSDQSTTTTITSNSVTIPTFSCQTLHLAHPHSQHTPALVLPLHPGMPFKHKSDPFDFLFPPPPVWAGRGRLQQTGTHTHNGRLQEGEATARAATEEKGCRDLLWSCCLQSPPQLQQQQQKINK